MAAPAARSQRKKLINDVAGLLASKRGRRAMRTPVNYGALQGTSFQDDVRGHKNRGRRRKGLPPLQEDTKPHTGGRTFDSFGRRKRKL